MGGVAGSRCDRGRPLRARSPLPGSGRRFEPGARRVARRAKDMTEDDPGVSVGESVAAAILSRSFDRRRRAGEFPVHRAWGGHSWCVGGRRFCPNRAAGLGQGHAVGLAQRITVPARWSSVASQQALRPRLQRGQGAGIPDQRGTDERADARSRGSGPPRLRRSGTRSPRQMIEAWDLDLSEERPGVRAPLPRRLRRGDRVLGCQVHLQLLATHYRHSERPRWMETIDTMPES